MSAFFKNKFHLDIKKKRAQKTLLWFNSPILSYGCVTVNFRDVTLA